jgi:hypothetical protein
MYRRLTNRQGAHRQAMSTDKHLMASAAHCAGWRHIGLSNICRTKSRPWK